MLLGIATTFNEGAFTAKSTYDIIERLGVTSLAGSPTAFRLLLAEGAAPAARIKGRLRVVSSAGEPLNPEVIRWFDAHLGVPIHDHYGQTENGMMVNNHHGLSHKVRPGSAGFAMPGYRIVVLDEAGQELGPNQPGILAVDIANSPLRWFDGYHQARNPGHSGRLLPQRRHGRVRAGRRDQLHRSAPTTSSPRPATASARSTSKAR